MFLCLYVINICFLGQVLMRSYLAEIGNVDGRLEPVTTDITKSNEIDTEKNGKMDKRKNAAEQFLLSQLEKDDFEIFQMLPEDKKQEVFNHLGNILASNGKAGKDYQDKWTEQDVEDVEDAVQELLPKVSKLIRSFKSLVV